MKHAALIFLAVASVLILVSFIPGLPGGAVLFAVLGTAFPVALMVLGAARGRKLGPLFIPLVVLVVILVGSVIGMIALRGRVLAGPWIGGLPLTAAIQLYGMWLLPLGLVALAYALTFETFTLRQGDLERLERMSEGRESDTEEV